MNTKIRLVQMNVIPGNPFENFKTCSSFVKKAKEDNIEVLVFPELCLSGYLIGDMWEEMSFLEDCEYYGEELAKLSSNTLTIIFGNVFIDRELYGTDGRIVKLNGSFVAQRGKFCINRFNGLSVYPKTLLPNYREFEEPRHFKDGLWYAKHKGYEFIHNFEPITINLGLQIGITICEDGWDADYGIHPIQNCALLGADLILNLSCSPFTINKNISRDKVFSSHAKNNSIPVCYVNTIGLQNNSKTIFTFDGSTVVYDDLGNIITSINLFEEKYIDIGFDSLTKKVYPIGFPNFPDELTEIEQIHKALIFGIKSYMKQSKLTKVVIGSSGGIDSAVVAALYAEAIGKDNLLLVNMPSEFNSQTTINLSKQLATNIGCYYTTIPIGVSIALTKEQINNLIIPQLNSGNNIKLNLSNFDLENIQARDRSARILAAVACAFNGVFTNNGNKTEASVGYCTMLGDLAGFVSTIGDLWKTQVYELGRELNKNKEIIPKEIFEIIPSAELSAEQCLDKGKGDPLIYWYHDNLFKSWVERWNRITPTEILEHYISKDLCNFLGINKSEDSIHNIFKTDKLFIEDLEYWWKKFKGISIAKRVQGPPILAVSRRAFGFDYRETLNCVYFSKKYLQLKKDLNIIKYKYEE
jgi:NAD+ synthase (glutamine-hydrolysing)